MYSKGTLKANFIVLKSVFPRFFGGSGNENTQNPNKQQSNRARVVAMLLCPPVSVRTREPEVIEFGEDEKVSVATLPLHCRVLAASCVCVCVHVYCLFFFFFLFFIFFILLLHSSWSYFSLHLSCVISSHYNLVKRNLQWAEQWNRSTHTHCTRAL